MAASVIGDLFVRLGLDATELNTNLGSAEKRLEKFGTQLFFLGSRITAGVSLPLGAAVAMISEFGMGFDKAMTESLAIMDNVSGAMRKSMEDVAKFVSTTTKFSSEEAAKGFYGLASAGLDATAAMGALPIAARFAQAGIMDLAKATDFLATAQAAMASGSESSAEKVQQMGRVADVLTEANNRAIGTIQDFAEALTNKAGAALRQSNKTIEEGVAVLAAYASQGIKGKEAGQQLWMSIRDLGIAALKHRDAFAKFGIAVYDSTGAMRNMADIIADVERATSSMSVAERRDMFIKLGMPSRSIAATNALVGFSQAIKDNQTALENAGGVTQRVADKQMEALSNQLLNLGNRFKNVAIDLFSTFIPVIQNTLLPLIETTLKKIQELVTWFSTLPESVKLATLAIVGLGIVIGPLIAGFGSMSLLTAAAMRGLTVLTGGLAATTAAMGTTMGVSTKLAQMLSIMPARAAVAATAAYNLAQASGQSGFMLNRAATAAANAAGWSGKVTNALIAQNMATSTTVIATSNWQAVTNLIKGALSGLVGAGGKVLTWLGDLAPALMTGYAAFKLLGPTISSLWDSFSVGSLNAIASSTVLSRAWDAASGTAQTLNEALFVAGKGLQFLVEASMDVARAQTEQARQGNAVAQIQETMNDSFIRTLGPIGALAGGISDLSTELEKHKAWVDRVKAGWQELVMFWENDGDDALSALAKQIDKLKPPSLSEPKKDKFNAPLPTELWMLGTQSDFQRRMASQGTGEMPVLDPKKLTAAQSAAKNLADQWQENSKQVIAFRDAWELLSRTAQKDPKILSQVWESYDKLRQSQDVLIPSFEKLFAAQIEQQELQKELTYSLNEYGVVWSDNAIKFEDDAGKIYAALVNIRDKASLDAFWQKNSAAVEELIPFYDQLSPVLKVLVDRFQSWALATSNATGALQDMRAKASKSIGDYLASTAAKLTDVRSELTLFSKSYADKELVGLKKGLAQQELARKESYKEQLKNLAAFAGNPVLFAGNPVLFAMEAARLKAAQTNNEGIANAEYRLGLYRIAQSVGVNKRIIKDFEDMTDAQIEDIIRQKDAWNDLFDTLKSYNQAVGSIGDAFKAAGLDELGDMLAGISTGIDSFLTGANVFVNASNLGESLAGLAQMITGVINAFKALSDVGSRAMRAVGGAVAGATIGGAVAGPWGALVGAGIGALVGAFKADPGWKNVQKTVQYQWGLNVTKALATQIDKDAEVLGGHVNAMLMHMVDIINQNGGLSAGNVGKWAQRLGMTFNLLEQGQMGASQAADTLDASFGELLKVGTTTNGLINDQVRQLVILERQYKTGSKAIREFVDAQMSMIAGGLNKIVSGTFGSLMPGGSSDVLASLDRQKQLQADITSAKDRIAEINKKDVKTEQDKLELLALQFQMMRMTDALRREQAKANAAGKMMEAMSGPGGQEAFDRLGRLASVTFNAMIASGKSFLEALAAIGPALDMLSAAQATFGFTSSDTFSTLMRFREFAEMNPELVEAISGLQELMVGLSNTGFMTQQAFMDLGAEVTSTFDKLVAQGLTGDEALQVMQPTLQTLWELQQKFGYKVDEATQALIDQAVESGTVGEKYMSANDRMVLGIEKLIGLFEIFLKHLGIDIPKEAEAAAKKVEDAFNNVNPKIKVDYEYSDSGKRRRRDGDDGSGGSDDDTPPAMRAFRGPRMAIVPQGGPDAIVPLDRLFREVRASQQGEMEYLPVRIEVDGETLVKTSVRVGLRNGWIK